MESHLEASWERLWRWLRQHPLTAATAAAVLIAVLAAPSNRSTQPGAQPPVDLGPDEPPLFI